MGEKEALLLYLKNLREYNGEVDEISMVITYLRELGCNETELKAGLPLVPKTVKAKNSEPARSATPESNSTNDTGGVAQAIAVPTTRLENRTGSGKENDHEVESTSFDPINQVDKIESASFELREYGEVTNEPKKKRSSRMLGRFFKKR